MSKTLFVGIDISLKEATCCFLNQNGNLVRKIFKVDNNISGFEKLKEEIESAIPTNNFSLVCIGLEATSMYGFHLLDYFSTTDFKYPVKVKLYQINAKYVKRFKKAFPEKEKTDIVDCQFIAEYLRFGKLPAEYKPECLFLPLRRLVRYRYHIVKNLEKEKKLYMANLFLKFPGWVQNRPVASLGKTALDITREFTLDQLAEMPLEKLAFFVAKAGKNRSPDPVAIADEIQKAARESYRIRPELASSITFILASISRTISALKENLKQVDKAILAETKGFINPLISIKGIGPVYSTGILACIGDIKRFASHNQLARYAGLVWKRRQTGKTESEEKHMVIECDKYLRYYLIEAANSLRVHNELYRSYYQRKYKEVPKHQHKRAIVLTARKLVRVVFALLSKNQLYDQSRDTQSPRLSKLTQNCQRAI
ncbi:MAG: IS110 family transposase [Deltaproteobacteria bacterium]|uniref:IS110 family transposase n=1 Tax=Thermococcus sp. TaxID=35749 RepID=UPI002628BB2A|nr:IS110 family transposase [Thermococcus sp.]MCD6138981.1 IS110 family transposase [Deltaproteobacteria bacterium]MCD6143432.1 IS110 family transposase [Thermococcus sp.]